MADISNRVDHGSEEEFHDSRCWDADKHQAVSEARVVYGGARGTQVTVLCIFCNLKLRTWKEWPDEFTF